MTLICCATCIHTFDCHFGCVLLSVFFRKPFACAGNLAIDQCFHVKIQFFLVFHCFDAFEFDLDAVVLPPFEELRLVVGVVRIQFADVDIGFDYAASDELAAALVAVVEIEGADKRLEDVAGDVRVLYPLVASGQDVTGQAHLERYLVELCAADYLRAHLRQAAFVEVGELAEDVLGHHRAQYGVAQKLEALVVLAPVLDADHRRLVGEGHLVELLVARGGAGQLSYKKIKLLSLAGKKFYLSDKFYKRIHRALNMTEELCPPKPKVFDNATLTFRFCALLNVKLSLLSSSGSSVK